MAISRSKRKSINFPREILVYSIFRGVFLLLYLSFYSLGAFFHFKLGHDLATIQTWREENFVFLIAGAKFLSLMLVFAFSYPEENVFIFFKKMLLSKLKLPSRFLLINSVMVIVLLAFFYPKTPSLPPFDLGIFLGAIIFFTLEIFSLSLIDSKARLGRRALYSLIFFLSFLAIFDLSFETIALISLFHLFLSNLYFHSGSLSDFFLFLFGALFFLVPMVLVPASGGSVELPLIAILCLLQVVYARFLKKDRRLHRITKKS